jgi:hypothetical protein
MNIQCFANKAPLSSRSSDYTAPPEAYPSASVDEPPARLTHRFAAIKQRWPYVIIGISAASTLVWIGLLIRLAVSYAKELI